MPAYKICARCGTSYIDGDRHACAAPWTPDDPAYYRAEGQTYDAIDVIAAFKLDFDLGCVVKYILRAGRKPGNDFLTDLRKAKRVLERRIIREEKASQKPS